MTCVGLYLSNMASVSFLSRKSPSFDERNIHRSSGRPCASTYDLMACPTRPDPPVTNMTACVVEDDMSMNVNAWEDDDGREGGGGGVCGYL